MLPRKNGGPGVLALLTEAPPLGAEGHPRLTPGAFLVPFCAHKKELAVRRNLTGAEAQAGPHVVARSPPLLRVVDQRFLENLPSRTQSLSPSQLQQLLLQLVPSGQARRGPR